MSKLYVNEINPYSGNTVNINGAISATTYQNLPTSTVITGGTKTGSNVTFSNNTGGTFTITGFNDTYVTGATYSSGTAIFTNNTGNTFSITGLYTGATDVFLTGGTYSAGTAVFTNNTGGTFNVTGFSTNTGGGTDVFVTGGTYSTGTTVFTNSTGGTFNVTGFLTNNGVRIYRALLTDAPSGTLVVNVLENTLGFNLIWESAPLSTYSPLHQNVSPPVQLTGRYIAYRSGFFTDTFPLNKTFVTLNLSMLSYNSPTYSGGEVQAIVRASNWNDPSSNRFVSACVIYMEVYNGIDNFGSYDINYYKFVNSKLYNTPIEIRVYD
jgi:hypothetical protein